MRRRAAAQGIGARVSAGGQHMQMEEEIGVGSRRNNIILLIYIEGSNIITEVWLLAHRAVDAAGMGVEIVRGEGE
ncbi:MAG: hypothetical protein C5S33_09470 [ANME-2 cluster archaeon]|nr:hypothetical protein [ANME-2 cluster archaeon]